MSRRLSPRDILLVFFGAGVSYLLTSLRSAGLSPEPEPQLPSTDAPGLKSNLGHSKAHFGHLHKPTLPKAQPQTLSWPAQWIQPAPSTQYTTQSIPPTKLLHHAPGWTLFDDIYMANDTFYVVLPSKEDVQKAQEEYPETRLMVSRPLWALNEPQNIADREPVDGQTLAYITVEEAGNLWGKNGERVLVVEGNTVMVNEPSQFLNHYYHVIAELWLGIWVFWTGAHSNGGSTDAVPPPIHRLILARTPAQWQYDRAHPDAWHDRPGMNAFILHGVFPSMSIEDEEDWNDRVTISKDVQRAFRFPTLLLTDRSASHRGHWTGTQNQRIASEAWEYVNEKNLIPTFSLKRGKWWAPFREAVWRLVGVQDFHEWSEGKPVTITYWSRQLSRSRKLRPQDHDRLLIELNALATRKGWRFNHVDAEKITKDEQIAVLASTDIFLGVHGNGLSHLMFMPHSKISTVMELFYPQGFAHDYQWTSGALGHGYAAVWNDTHRSHTPKLWPNYPEGKEGDGGFQGNNIPVHAPYVVRLIEERVDGKVDLNT